MFSVIWVEVDWSVLPLTSLALKVSLWVLPTCSFWEAQAKASVTLEAEDLLMVVQQRGCKKRHFSQEGPVVEASWN